MDGSNDMPSLIMTARSDFLSPYSLYELAEGLRDFPETHEWIDDLAYTLAEIRDLPEKLPVRSLS